MPRNILRTLKTEHDALRELFDRMEQTTDRAAKTRTQLLDRIEANLLPHAKWEEQVFYPAFAERADREGLKAHAEALLEHHAVERQVIPEVHAAEVGTPEFAGRAKVFGDLIGHHADEEETELFKLARQLFSAAELAELDEQYEQWKQSPAAAAAVAGAKGKTGVKAAVASLAD